jgi:hypothetical protein
MPWPQPPGPECVWVPVDERVADQWGRLGAQQPLPLLDALLAATALVHDLTLVTRNVDDVARTGVKVLNPFSGGVARPGGGCYTSQRLVSLMKPYGNGDCIPGKDPVR